MMVYRIDSQGADTWDLALNVGILKMPMKIPLSKIFFGRWRRNRTERSLSLLQIHRKNNRTVKKVYKTTSDR